MTKLSSFRDVRTGSRPEANRDYTLAMPISLPPYGATFDEVILAVANELVKIPLLAGDTSRIRIILEGEETPQLSSEREIVIRVGGGPVGPQNGTLRIRTACSRRFDLIPRSRSSLDRVRQARELLTQPAMGHLQFEHQIVDCIQGFQPAVNDVDITRALVDKPIRVLSIGPPTRLVGKQSNPDGKWCVSVISCEGVLTMRLDQSRQ